MLQLVQKTVGDGLGNPLPSMLFQDSASPPNNYPAPVLYDPNGVFPAALAPLIANTAAPGIGAMLPIPTGGSNTAPVVIGVAPAGVRYCRLYIPAGAAVPFTIAANPTAAANQFAIGVFQTATRTLDGPVYDDNITIPSGLNLYIGAMTGVSTGSPTQEVPSYRFG